jgi:hypothetical protein
MPTPICGTDCNSLLPPVNFDKCNPTVLLSEIRRIFIASVGAAVFTDWTNATEWIARLSESTNSIDAIRPLTVIADKPAAAAVTAAISNGRTIVIRKDHTVNYTIDDVTEENYEFLRTVIECGGQVKFWYETEGGYLYGGPNGISPANITGDDILNRGTDQFETIGGTLTWKNKFSPERVLSPIFDSSVDDLAPTTFNVVQTFVSDTEDTDNGVTTTVAATSATTTMEFNSIASPVGLPNTMILRIATVQVATVDFPSDYLNQYFRFKSSTGTVYSGKRFTDGTVNLA